MTDDRSPDCTDISRAHNLLSSPVRRAVLRELREREAGKATVESLAHAVPTRLPEPPSRSLRVPLHHTHLPKLATADIVDYDPDQQVVRYIGDQTVERLLEVGSDD